MTFTGFARRRRRIQQSASTASQQQIAFDSEQFLDDFELQQRQQKESATNALNLLRKQFELDQDARDAYYALQSEQAQFKRELAQSRYDEEIANLDAIEADRTSILESISGISKTAYTYLQERAEKIKTDSIAFGEGMVYQYGLSPQDIADLSEIENSLDNAALNDIAALQKMREMGASESDIQRLIGVSGWAKEGAVRAAVQNAALDYPGYISDNFTTEFEINGQPASLQQAELDQSSELQAAVLDRIRGQFITEYLPNVKPEYIANYAKDSFAVADAKRKLSLDSVTEKTALQANQITEAQNLNKYIQTYRKSATGQDVAQTAQDYLLKIGNASNIEELKNNLPLLNRHVKYLADGVRTQAISIEAADEFLQLNNFAFLFPDQAKEIIDSITVRQNEIQRVISSTETQQTRNAQSVYAESDKIFQDLVRNGQPVTDELISGVASRMEELGIAPRIYRQYVSRLAESYKQYDESRTNDRNFDELYGADIATGIYPSLDTILTSGLSPAKLRTVLNALEDPTQNLIDDKQVKQYERVIRPRLKAHLFDGMAPLTGEISETLEPAILALTNEAVEAYRTAMELENNPRKADQAAQAVINKAIEDGKKGIGIYAKQDRSLNARGALIYNREFPAFMNGNTVRPTFSTDKLDTANLVRSNPDAVRTTQLIPVKTLKDFVSARRSNRNVSLPFELRNIILADVTLNAADVLREQIALANANGANIPEMPADVLRRVRSAQVQQPLPLEEFRSRLVLQTSDLQSTLNRSFQSRRLSEPYSDAGARKEPVLSTLSFLVNENGITDANVLAQFLAVMKAESATFGYDRADTSTSGTDPNKEFEHSLGRFQINVKDPAILGRVQELGFTAEDMRSPRPNLIVAYSLYKDNGFNDWSTFGGQRYNSYYAQSLREAQQFLQQQGNTVWRESSNIRSDISSEQAQQLGVYSYGGSGTDFEVGGQNQQIAVTKANDGISGTDFAIPGGRGAKFYFPYGGRVKNIEIDTEEIDANVEGYRPDFGTFVELEVTLPNGNTSDLIMAHFDDVNPQLYKGAIIPPNTYIGTQGRTGSTTGPHVSFDWYNPDGSFTKNTAARDWFLNNYLYKQPQF